MSHSRILVLDNNRNVDCDEIFEEMQTYGNSVDYVTEPSSVYADDLEWFLRWAEDYGMIPTDGGFEIEDKEAFYVQMRDTIEANLDDLQGLGRWKIADAVRMTQGFWVYHDDTLDTFPYFMEQVKNGDKFKIKSFLDYHF